ncbi:hypothetical protein DL764_009964 [Monosporascus ibericus]|uniref:Uncharacterized protein n=1 Tax=Monosporascus ibericus TaxID=155417 RepID=A0A4Q4STM8_9PEZI|nr:hypothetical protein DL764_009964 [Monosporascus ibericus]
MAQAQQQNEEGRGTRLACFFAGLGLAVNQLGFNVTANALPGGLRPRRHLPPVRLYPPRSVPHGLPQHRRQLLAPRYMVANRRKINVDDPYKGAAGSIYWYGHGFN